MSYTSSTPSESVLLYCEVLLLFVLLLPLLEKKKKIELLCTAAKEYSSVTHAQEAGEYCHPKRLEDTYRGVG